MNKRITITLTEDQIRELRDLVRARRVGLAQKQLERPQTMDVYTDEQAFISRLETTLVKQLTKS